MRTPYEPQTGDVIRPIVKDGNAFPESTFYVKKVTPHTLTLIPVWANNGNRKPLRTIHYTNHYGTRGVIEWRAVEIPSEAEIRDAKPIDWDDLATTGEMPNAYTIQLRKRRNGDWGNMGTFERAEYIDGIPCAGYFLLTPIVAGR